MQLGKTLLGAIIGGALGIAALIAVQYFTGFDKAWLAILVALLTGLGVRAMVATQGHASYLRGAITGILVLVAYWGGTELYSELVARGVLAKKLSIERPVAAGAAEDAAADGPAGDADAAPAEPVFERPDLAARGRGAPGEWRRNVPGASPWDYVAMIIAALVGYELGRGTSVAKATIPRQEPEADSAGNAT
jgi:hypothetical protein